MLGRRWLWQGALACAAGMLAAVSAAPALAADTIYWTAPYTANQIYFANLDGSTVTPSMLNTSGATVAGPWGLAPDPAAGKIYWANYGSSGGTKISWANLDGSGGGDLNTGAATVSGPTGVVVDHAAGKLYWANSQGNKISWANLDGSGGSDLNTGVATVNNPIGVAIDAAQGKIYWANYGGTAISFAKLDNTGGGDLQITGTTVNKPWAVAIDQAIGKIYWGNYMTNTLDYANLDGTGGGPLSTSGATQTAPMPGPVDPTTGRLYWANYGGVTTGTIAYANADGSGGGGTLYTTVANPAMPSVLEAPAGMGAPTVTAAAAGAPTTLSCSLGSWQGDDLGALLYHAPQSFSYGWQDNGTAISGASGHSIAVTLGGSYTCRVTATNYAGSTTQTSHAVMVAPPPPLKGSAGITTSGAAATVKISCNGVAGQSCSGVVTMTAHKHKLGAVVVAVTARKHKKKKKKLKRTVVAVTLGAGSYRVLVGASTTLHLTLNAEGKRLLALLYRTTATFTFSGTPVPQAHATFAYGRIRSPVSYAWLFYPAYTTAQVINVSAVPRGASVTLSCRGRGCPLRLRTIKHKRNVALARLLKGAHLAPKTKVTVSITAPNSVGKVNIYTMHAGTAPTQTKRCLPPGARKPAICTS